jgi:folylpolyglutamate synthase
MPCKRLGLAGSHQVQNASLAVELAKQYMQETTGSVPGEEHTPIIMDGLAEAKWPGRCQTIQDPVHKTTRWYLDGAHTVESLDCCMTWFISPGVGLPSNVTT